MNKKKREGKMESSLRPEMLVTGGERGPDEPRTPVEKPKRPPK